MSNLSFETERLIIRPTDEIDAAFLLELMNTPSWLRYIGDRNIKTTESAKEYIRSKMTPQLERLGYSNYTVIRKEDETKIGTCGLYDREGLEGIDIGFAFLPEYERSGYAFEAAQRLQQAAFHELGVSELRAITTDDNSASIRLLEKLGFSYSETTSLPGIDTQFLLYKHHRSSMKVHTLRIEKNIDGQEVVLHPVLLNINGELWLVDCGYEETFPEFISELNMLGIKVQDLYAILITHDDIDHLGALKQFKDVHPGLMVYCSEAEEPSVSGKVKSERLEQAERSLSKLPAEHLPWAQQFIQKLENIQRVNVDRTLKDREMIGGKVQVICTPGHTKGHISLYIPSMRTVIANDALVVEGDEFNIANPMYTLDLNNAVRSAEVIRELHPLCIICYHGGVADRDVDERLNRMISYYRKPVSENDESHS